ncbi:MAG: flagellar assembly peptidoglycan hydrolase FlgJ [Gammaproteobacteria bacterium]|nr:flagellar assembly peptidoglycan hydrolase FlgJ [Gammaproteobacteria bacterium]
MSITSINTYTDFQGLAQLKAEAKANSPEALRETARQFETIFVQMMLKSMRDATASMADEEGLLDNDQSKQYMEMFDQQLALDLTKNKGIGLADILVRQLGGEVAEKEKPNVLSIQRFQERVAAIQPSAVISDQAEFSPKTPDVFIRELWPYAQNAAKKIGVDAKVLVAQAALETGWGQEMIRHEDGRNSFNLFAIKANSAWQGSQVNSRTHEYEQGQKVQRTESFRAYDSLAQSFTDYANFIQSNPRYQGALEKAHNSAAYLDSLVQAGYATDPEYSSKIQSIMSGDRFSEAIDQLKLG